MPEPTRWLRIALVISIYAAVIVFSWDYLQGTDLRALWQSKPVWPWLLAATLVELANRFLFAVAWILLLSHMAPIGSLQLRKLLDVFAKSWIARYLPGSGTWLAARVVLARNIGLHRRDVAVATATEALIQLATLSLLGAVVLTRSNPLPGAVALSQWSMWLIVIVAACVLYPRFFSAASQVLSRWLRRPGLALTRPVPLRGVLQVAVVFVITSVLSSCGILFTTLALAPEIGADWVQVFFVAVLSSLASILAFFAPAGLGVREAVLVFGLAPIAGGSTALLVAVLHRGLSLVWDLAFLLATRVNTRAEQ